MAAPHDSALVPTHACRVLKQGGLQLVLVILIALLMPRSSILGGSKGSTVSITEQAEGQSTNIAASSGEEYFSVIFDAGSTGAVLIACPVIHTACPAGRG